jgi:hypothetical protein
VTGLRRKEGRERVFHVDDATSNAEVLPALSLPALRTVADSLGSSVGLRPRGGADLVPCPGLGCCLRTCVRACWYAVHRALP